MPSELLAHGREHLIGEVIQSLDPNRENRALASTGADTPSSTAAAAVQEAPVLPSLSSVLTLSGLRSKTTQS